MYSTIRTFVISFEVLILRKSNVTSGKYTNGSRHYSVTAINIKPRCSYSMLKGLEFDIKEFPCFVFLLQQIDFEMKYKRNIRLRK